MNQSISRLVSELIIFGSSSSFSVSKCYCVFLQKPSQALHFPSIPHLNPGAHQLTPELLKEAASWGSTSVLPYPIHPA